MDINNNVADKKRLLSPIRIKLHEIIFEAETKAGKAFDVILLWAILLSVFTVMLESVSWISADYLFYIQITEWVFTILFTIEYVLRIISIGRGLKYVISFMGIIDLLALLPTYISLLVVGSQYLVVIRIIRVLRVFRILKLTQFIGNAQLIIKALRSSFSKITVFLIFILTLVTILGTVMYLIEGPDNGFRNIPVSIYWAIVTLTTVGYGDITPNTILGQALSSLIMITGYAIIAVPTGIVTVELQKTYTSVNTKACVNCYCDAHEPGSKYCKNCGVPLSDSKIDM